MRPRKIASAHTETEVGNPLRSNGVAAKKFATEAFMDEVARRHGQDPLAFRLELMKGTPRAYNAVTIARKSR